MKSKRVAKLLSCVLAASMACTVPVAASATGNKTSGEFTADVAVNSATMKVTVPTKMNVAINPLFSSATNTVSGSRVASDEFVIKNTTSANDGTYVPLICTATAQVTRNSDDVQLSYKTFTASDTSSKKKVYLAFKSPNSIAVSKNNTYDGSEAPLTTLKTRYQVKVDAATNATTAGYGAFAVIGEANTGADWGAKDLTVKLTYDLKAVGSSVQPVNVPTNIPEMTIVSNNIATAATKILDSTVLTAAVLNEATVTHVQIHSPKNVIDDLIIPAGDAKLDIKYEMDTTSGNTDPEIQKCTVSFAKNCPTLKAFVQNRKGEKFEAVVVLSDGRRIVVGMPIPS